MKNLIYLLSFLLLLTNCNRTEVEENENPECLSSLIIEIQNRPPQTPRVTVKKYIYQNKIVYVFFNLRYPDGPDVIVYDENCNFKCFQGYSFAGIFFNTCTDWNSATYISTIWTDPR